MKLIYKGDSSELNFNVEGVGIRVTPNTPLIITAKQAESLQERNYIKALVEKCLLEFVEADEAKAEVKAPDANPENLSELTKDELIELAKSKGADFSERDTKAEIIKAIEESK